MELKLLRNKKKRHPLRYIVLCAVFVVFMISAFSIIASNNKQIKLKKQELESIKAEISVQEVKNADLRSDRDRSDEESRLVLEKAARVSLDYAYPTERIFIIVAGN